MNKPAVLLTASLLGLTLPATVATSWRGDGIWDDGQAEYAAYRVTWPRYGAPRHGEALIVVVKEPWAPDLGVKADTPRANGFEVLKLNHLRQVPTGIYTYHQIASAFVRRDDGRLVKLATSSFEACGLTSAELVEDTLATSSYFDGQGRRSVKWPSEAVPEDALPLMLRDHLFGEIPATLVVFPSLLSARLPPLEARPMRLERRTPPNPVTTPAGSFEVIELHLSAEGRSLTYQFERALPHRLIHFEGSDGTVYELTKAERLRYWELNQPGAEEWWPPR